ncbi:sulfate adenylyltransferase subunit 2 [Candidatus Planktophila versatilis]|jgi:sulfate adenylyltransferase subunit 2|uniref:Sulfate adenylyltransferase subunit 2 n=1 Tax=Candidatus Planktophila versatilis TaxID=1884905 RepID=A0ABN5BI00_9ACTN|nr:sulfate adenylyltransferase subunit CysD [Candidatus Planktophila versatilis]ASY17813.1 sulfate adenylyltransferase subunit 2 [Candidatus Planktophila versatilis]ASY19133.1 sulfate adenylyltransferase subunit 2 [Candidatus Planktophila versatilis]
MSIKSRILKELENESIEIFRETAVGFRKPVMMYSIGKDSTVLLHLARKAFYPAAIPFPLLHIDTTWKFKEMIAFRDRVVAQTNSKLIVHTNQAGVDANINPFTTGISEYTRVMKTVALREALDFHGFDAAIGGSRRDEEKSRAKERIFSVRDPGHRWNPREQRPELWNTYNTRLGPGQTMRVFPISDWTENDIWHYILQEGIEVNPLYFAKERPVVKRGEQLIMVDDDRYPLQDGETPFMKQVRFRTLGCYPLTAAVESNALTIEDVVEEVLQVKLSERATRLIDGDNEDSMEKKKSEGYF